MLATPLCAGAQRRSAGKHTHPAPQLPRLPPLCHRARNSLQHACSNRPCCTGLQTFSDPWQGSMRCLRSRSRRDQGRQPRRAGQPRSRTAPLRDGLRHAPRVPVFHGTRREHLRQLHARRHCRRFPARTHWLVSPNVSTMLLMGGTRTSCAIGSRDGAPNPLASQQGGQRGEQAAGLRIWRTRPPQQPRCPSERHQGRMALAPLGSGPPAPPAAQALARPQHLPEMSCCVQSSRDSPTLSRVWV